MEVVVEVAHAGGLAVRGGLQCAFGCRIAGEISIDHVLDLVKSHLDTGLSELALADSTGMGHPALVRDLMGAVLELAGDIPVFLHLHDTEGKGMANALAAIQVGARHFDTALGGLGGCPFIEGATGNIATEDLAHMCGEMGFETGVNVPAVAAVTRALESLYDDRFPGKMHRVLENTQIQGAA